MPASSWPGPAQGETPVFVSAHPLRRLLVRGGIGVLAGLFAIWVIALASGVSGIGSLPGLQDKDRGATDSAEATKASQAPASDPAALDALDASTEIGASNPSSSHQGQRSPQRAGGGTGTQTSPTPVAPGTGETTGPPIVTPGGNVPGANANSDAGNAYGGGQGGGRTKTD
jgi:hypothetical protein